MNRVAVAFIDLTTLAHMLQLPAGHSIAHADWRMERNQLAVMIEGPQLPECQRGALLPEVNAVIDSRPGPAFSVVQITWQFPQPKTEG